MRKPRSLETRELTRRPRDFAFDLPPHVADEFISDRLFARGPSPQAATAGVSFSINPIAQSVSEGGNISFKISISNPNYPAIGSYKIYWRTNATADHAASTSDYNSVSTLQPLTFSATGAQSYTVSIHTNTDSSIEGTEYFEVDLYDFQGNYLSGSATVFTIFDVPPAKPDLQIGNLTITPNAVQAGGGFTVSAWIFNDGNASAVGSTAKLYLSRNGTIDANDFLIGTFSISSLAPDARSSDFGKSMLLPSDWQLGTSYVIVDADTTNAVSESSESNNSFKRSFTVTSSGTPDLAIGNVTVTPGSVQAGGGYTASAWIFNNGNATAGATTAKLYLSRDGSIDASDVLLGAFSISSLAAGARSDDFGKSVLLPTNWQPGTSYIIVAADTADVVTESSESNNSYGKAFTVVDAPRADLVIGSLALGSSSVQSGTGVSINFSIVNNGNATAGASTARLYISHDQFLDAGDTQLQSFAIPILAAGQSASGGISAPLPPGWSIGTSYIIIAADTGNVVAEASEANNSYGRALAVVQAAAPDLVIGSLSLGISSVQAGSGVSVSFSIVNNGTALAAASDAILYISQDPFLGPEDTALQSFSIPSLAAGHSESGGSSFLLPPGWPTGTGYIIIAADTGHRVVESSEANNSYGRALTVTEPTAADAVVSSNMVLEMVRLAVDAYAEEQNHDSMWRRMTAAELGLVPSSGGGLSYTFVGGAYRASNGFNHADAIVLRAIIDSKVTLAIAFRGTDEQIELPTDFTDYIDFDTHYAKFAPLIAAIDAYLANPDNGIEQVLVSGHSLGAAMVQHFMAATAHGDNRFRAVTIGSPGGDNVGGRDDDPRIVNFGHTDDAVFLLAPVGSEPLIRGVLAGLLPPALAPLIASIGEKDRQGSTIYLNSGISSLPSLAEHTPADRYLSSFTKLLSFATDVNSPFRNSAVGEAIASGNVYSGAPVYIAIGIPGSNTNRIEISSRDDWVLGGAGDDRMIWELNIDPSAHFHRVDGGIGFDTIVLTGFRSLWDIQSTGSIDRLTYAGRLAGELTRVEKIVFSFFGTDAGSGSFNQAPSIVGPAAAMVLYLDGRATTIQRPTSGQTTINVDSAYDYLDAGNGNLGINGTQGDDVILLGLGTQNVAGSGGNDIITAASSHGMPAGSLTVNGGAGNDLITGDSEMPERLVASFTGNRADYSFALVGDRIVVTDLRIGSPDGTDSLQQVSALRFLDGDFTAQQLLIVILSGTNDADSLIGGVGSDQLYGNGGDDLISGGEAGNDFLFGGLGNDFLISGPGVDRMEGGLGDDSYFVDNSNDYVVEGPSEGSADRIFTSVSYSMAPGVHVETLSTDSDSGTAPISLAGNELDNVIRGNAGANNLFGLGGNDELTGLGGNDNYVLDNPLDRVVEAPNEGYDAIFVSFSYALALDVSIEVLATSDFDAPTAINLTGNSLDQHIQGNAGANVLDGGGGSDLLVGGAGNDILIGGGGGDNMYGGAGADTFVFTSFADMQGFAIRSDGKKFFADVLADFVTGEDKLDLSAIDAISGTPGNDAFTFIGHGAFSNHAGELRGYIESGVVRLAGDLDGDGIGDFVITVVGSIYVTDIIL